MSQLSLSLLVSLAVLAACTPKPGQEPQEPVVKYHEGRETVVAGEFGYNPISPMGVYMADPSAKVIDGKLYVACSLDLTMDTWCTPYHHMLSTEDVLHWTLHPNTFAAKGPYDEVSYSDAALYAPDIADKDGKYYLYYDLSEWTEGVAVADSPVGRTGTVGRSGTSGALIRACSSMTTGKRIISGTSSVPREPN